MVKAFMRAFKALRYATGSVGACHKEHEPSGWGCKFCRMAFIILSRLII
jgi:hypothetical protein